MPARPTHKMTLSQHAHDHLNTLLCKPPSRMSIYRNSRKADYDFLSGATRYEHGQLYQRPEGISFALDLLATSYDLTEWTDVRARIQGIDRSLWYIPYDAQYAIECQQDPTPVDQLSYGERKDRLINQSRLRWRYDISIIHLQYYYDLARFHRIPTLNPRSKRTPVAFAAAALEAIGCQFLAPPPLYKSLILDTPNRRKYHNKDRDGHRRYGNHAGTPWTMWKPIKLPQHVQDYTQEHVDYCLSNHLCDLAIEACAVNPTLQYALPTAPQSQDLEVIAGV